MRHYLAKICLLLALSHFSITEWVEISKSQSKPIGDDGSHRTVNVKQLTVESPPKEGFTTPSPMWIEYQRERFGLTKSNSNGNGNSNSNPLVVSDAGGLKNSAQIVVPINSQVIHARTKLVVHSTDTPVNVDVDVLVTPKVETTSRRHSSNVESAESVSNTATQQTAESEHESLVPSLKGFIKFMLKMQRKWVKKSTLSIEKKIKLLKEISNNLMKVIEEQFSVLWQPTEWKRRKRRGLLDESNLDFPPEAALMSINFLTFAVFLIKLVLQVVQIVKSKHYNFSGFNINTEVVRNP
ncbi:uncharacterized protein LOC132784243 [Drosophila nasuta]|uniref:uncharacterized protein LOC132784243 n=1 Tax=Drosophila nasuta TaxID=42062 RepID=UPI00295F06A9|nr:uncharacterized protein LOC132784243 [Drosophila nasuta]